MSRKLVLALAVLMVVIPVLASAEADSRSALEVVEASREMLRGDRFHAVIRIEVTRGDRVESQLIEAWSEGDDSALIRIHEPQDEAGNAYLFITEGDEQRLWYYDHSAGEVISLPGVALHDGFLGGGLDLDELLRGTVTEQYEVAFSDEQPDAGYLVELVPLPQATVVYGRLTLTISPLFVITQIQYYDQRGSVVKSARTEDVMTLGERLFPRVWIVEERTGNRTVAVYESLAIDSDLPEDIFTLERLQQP